jgi:thiamine-phosphate diphosphorylase
VKFPPLHVVTTDALLEAADFDLRAAALLEAGGPRLALHLRGPRTPGRILYERARVASVNASGFGAHVVVNERADVGRAAETDGVQLGRGALSVLDVRSFWPDAWIGRSVHSADEAAGAAEEGTDFILLGTIWTTATHPGKPAAGPGLIRSTAAACTAPVVAIGGVDIERVAVARRAGARGIAVIGAVWQNGRPQDNLVALLAAWDRASEYEDGERA